MTREEFTAAIKEISELTGDNDAVMERLAAVQNAFNELEAPNVPLYTEVDVFDDDGVRWSQKYDDMRRRYRERFFGGIEEAKDDQNEDIEKDDTATEMSFEELFDGRESDYKGE